MPIRNHFWSQQVRELAAKWAAWVQSPRPARSERTNSRRLSFDLCAHHGVCACDHSHIHRFSLSPYPPPHTKYSKTNFLKNYFIGLECGSIRRGSENPSVYHINHKPRMMEHTWNSGIWEVEAAIPEVQSHPWQAWDVWVPVSRTIILFDKGYEVQW